MNDLNNKVISSTSLAFFAFIQDLCEKYKQMIDPNKDFTFISLETFSTLIAEFEKLDENNYLNLINDKCNPEQNQSLTDSQYIKNISAFLFLYDKFQMQFQLNLKDSAFIVMLASRVKSKNENDFQMIWDLMCKLSRKNKIIVYDTFLRWTFLDINIMIFYLFLIGLILKDNFSLDRSTSLVLSLHQFDNSLTIERLDADVGIDYLLFLNYSKIKFYHFLLTCPQNYYMSVVQISFTFIKEIYDEVRLLPNITVNRGSMLPLYYSSLSTLFDFLPKEISTLTYIFVGKTKSEEFAYDRKFLSLIERIHNIPGIILLQWVIINDDKSQIWSASECFDLAIGNFMLYNFVKNIGYLIYPVTLNIDYEDCTIKVCCFSQIQSIKCIRVYLDSRNISTNDETYSPAFIRFLKNFHEAFNSLQLQRQPRNADKSTVTIFDSIAKSFWTAHKKNNSVTSSLSNLEFRSFFYLQFFSHKDSSYIFLQHTSPLYPIPNVELIVPNLMMLFDDIFIEDYDRSNKNANKDILYFFERGSLTNIFYYFRPPTGEHQIHMYFNYFRRKDQLDMKYEYCLLIIKIIEFFISLSKISVKTVLYFDKDFFIFYMDSKDFQSHFTKLKNMVNKIVFLKNKKIYSDSFSLIHVENSNSAQILILNEKSELEFFPQMIFFTDNELFILKYITQSFTLTNFHFAFNSGGERKSFLVDSNEISYTCSSFHFYENYEQCYSLLSQEHNHAKALVRFKVSNFDETVKTLLEALNYMKERHSLLTDELYNESITETFFRILFINVKERSSVVINSGTELFKFCKTFTGFDRRYYPINIISYNLGLNNPIQFIEKLKSHSSNLIFNQMEVISGECLSSEAIPCFEEIRVRYGYEIKTLLSHTKTSTKTFLIESAIEANSSLHLLFCIKRAIPKLQRKPIMSQIIKFIGRRTQTVVIYYITNMKACLNKNKNTKCIMC